MYRLLSALLGALLLFGGLTSALSAADLQRRISIAISGGASKGAYEAGLNWGLLKILQDIDKIDVLLMGQSHDLEAASFSGASAGGINTLLSGLVWCSLPESDGGLVNTIESNIFRDVWLIPDVNRLLPPTADSEFYSPDDALLSRHDLLQASGILRERWNQPGFRTNCRIPLGVTVTRVIPEEFKVGNIEVRNQRLFIPFVAHTQDDGSIGFYFDPGEFPAVLDPSMILLPREHDAPPYSIDDQRIEDAVTTRQSQRQVVKQAAIGKFSLRQLVAIRADQLCWWDSFFNFWVSFCIAFCSKSAQPAVLQALAAKAAGIRGAGYHRIFDALIVDGIGWCIMLARQQNHRRVQHRRKLARVEIKAE